MRSRLLYFFCTITSYYYLPFKKNWRKMYYFISYIKSQYSIQFGSSMCLFQFSHIYCRNIALNLHSSVDVISPAIGYRPLHLRSSELPPYHCHPAQSRIQIENQLFLFTNSIRCTYSGVWLLLRFCIETRSTITRSTYDVVNN